MNEIKVFENEEFGFVRTIEVDNKIMFCGFDIAKSLGYSIPSKAVNTHCKGVSKMEVPTNGGNQEMLFITEGDLYRLITHSKLPSAEKFEHWVFDQVLPSIRKHGAYMTPEVIEQTLTNPDFIIQLATRLKEEQQKNKELSLDNEVMKPKAEYFDDLVDRNLLTNFRTTAKQFEIKERIFIKFLLENKYLYRDNTGKLMPYADKNDGLFEVKECLNKKTKWGGTQTFVTPKGRETFRLLCRKLQQGVNVNE